MIIAGVSGGEPLFSAASGEQALLAFRADMVSNELEEPAERGLVKLLSVSSVAVETGNPRRHRFGDADGILFDLDTALSDGLNYKGVAGPFVSIERLDVMVFLGAEPFCYEKPLDAAMVIIKRARARCGDLL